METWPDDAPTWISMAAERSRIVSPEVRSKKNISAITELQYGERVGVYRILDILRNEEINATFFVNGRTVDAFPELMKQVMSAGHELSSENWHHQNVTMVTREEEHSDLKRTVDTFQRILGFRPQGFMMPGERPTEDTPRVLVELGYKYWMSFLHEDLPYVLTVGRGEIVVASYGLAMTDYNGGHPEASANPLELYQLWKDNFDCLYEEGATYPGFMSLGVHPFLTGRPFRATVFREFLRYVKSHPGVWFARGIDLANYWLENCRDHLIEKWPNYGTGLPYERTLAKSNRGP
ncbi:MAG: polysaccharide deacetylase family protein [Candidatus Binatia bacterium]